MRICIYGAGAIGGNLAAGLHRGGVTPALIARGAHLAAIRSRGLTVRLHDGSETRLSPEATEDPRDLGQQDLVIVTAKAPALPSVAAGIAPLLGPDTTVLFALNGIPWWYFQSHGGLHDGKSLPRLDPGGALARAVTPERIMGGIVYAASTVVEPGVVEVNSARNKLVIGEIDGRVTPRAETLAKIFVAGGIDAPVSPRIRDEVWNKLISNISNGTLAILAQSSFKTVYDEPACLVAQSRSVAEASAIAAAMGCKPNMTVESILAHVRHSPHKPSGLQDLELGRPMEVDAIYTMTLEMARLTGVETPTLDLLVALVKLRAKAAGLYNG